MQKTNMDRCELLFGDFEGNVRELFKTEHLLMCFNEENSLRYVNVLSSETLNLLFNDEDLIDSVICFFKNNLNVSKTSKNGYLHRNTLSYRLDKIKNLIGLNLRNFEDALIFQNLMTVRNFLKEKNKG